MREYKEDKYICREKDELGRETRGTVLGSSAWPLPGLKKKNNGLCSS